MAVSICAENLWHITLVQVQKLFRNVFLVFHTLKESSQYQFKKQVIKASFLIYLGFVLSIIRLGLVQEHGCFLGTEDISSPSRCGSAIGASSACALEGGGFHFGPRTHTWVAGSNPIHGPGCTCTMPIHMSHIDASLSSSPVPSALREDWMETVASLLSEASTTERPFRIVYKWIWSVSIGTALNFWTLYFKSRI